VLLLVLVQPLSTRAAITVGRAKAVKHGCIAGHSREVLVIVAAMKPDFGPHREKEFSTPVYSPILRLGE
jgi:hypothetical protein